MNGQMAGLLLFGPISVTVHPKRSRGDVLQVSLLEDPFPPVLVSAGTELIFFLVAGTVLCFAFSVRIMLMITHWCFSCC